MPTSTRVALRVLLLVALLPCLGFEWPGRVYRIQRRLERADTPERIELVRELATLPAAEAEQALLFALEDRELDVRVEAAAAAARVDLRSAAPLLLEWLDDKEVASRRAAVAALGQLREAKATAQLTRALGDASGDVRRAAVVALARIGTAEVVAGLIGRLEDLDVAVRMEAISALGELRDARAVVPLLRVASDPAADLRAHALRALGDLGDAQALPLVMRALADATEDVQLAAAGALGQLRAPSSVRAIKAALAEAEPRLTAALLAALARFDAGDARELVIAQLSVPGSRRAVTDALLRQAHALGARAPELVSALVDSLRTTQDEAGKRARAAALAELSQQTALEHELPRLLPLFAAERAETFAELALALGRGGGDAALMALLERLSRGDKAELPALLDALDAAFARGEPDGRAADPLLERLANTEPAEATRLVVLLGKVEAVRAAPALLPLITSHDPTRRLAAVHALGSIGAPEAGPALAELLAHADAETRFAAAEALRSTADAGVLAALTERLAGGAPEDRHALALAVGGAAGRLYRAGTLPGQTATRVLEVLGALVAQRDPELAERALDALAVYAHPDALDALALGLRSPSSRRRGAATLALASLPKDRARPIARYVMQQGGTRERVAAAVTLGEIGDHRDVQALLKLGRRHHWPVPGAVAYAIARLAQRGELRAHADRAELCALGASREPYVRANVAAAFAALGVPACDEPGPSPLRWLAPPSSALVRAAAARWLLALRDGGKLDAALANAALERCATGDVEASVREACAGPPRALPREPTDVYAYGPDGVTLLRGRLIALRLPDGTAYLGYADQNGHVRLPSAPQGTPLLEDPGQYPLESPR